MAYVTEEQKQAVETTEHEILIFRAPFRWRRREGTTVSLAYESYSPETVCEQKGWELVRKVGDHMAVVVAEY